MKAISNVSIVVKSHNRKWTIISTVSKCTAQRQEAHSHGCVTILAIILRVSAFLNGHSVPVKQHPASATPAPTHHHHHLLPVSVTSTPPGTSYKWDHTDVPLPVTAR